MKSWSTTRSTKSDQRPQTRAENDAATWRMQRT